jgi:hypothetical protein
MPGVDTRSVSRGVIADMIRKLAWGPREIGHLGSAHGGAEVELLRAAR